VDASKHKYTQILAKGTHKPTQISNLRLLVLPRSPVDDGMTIPFEKIHSLYRSRNLVISVFFPVDTGAFLPFQSPVRSNQIV